MNSPSYDFSVLQRGEICHSHRRSPLSSYCQGVYHNHICSCMILSNGHFKLFLSSCQGFRSSKSGSFRSSRRFGGFGSFSYSGSGFSSSGFGGSFRKSSGGGTSSLAQVLATRLRLSRIVKNFYDDKAGRPTPTQVWRLPRSPSSPTSFL